MNENLQSAVSDLSLIRQTMDKSRVQMKRLATLFFLYGGIQLAVMGAYLLWFVSGADTARADRIVLWVYHLVYMAIGVCWLVWRWGLRRTDNNYTLYLYDAWGYALLLMPLVALACMSVTSFRMNTEAQQAVMMLLWLAEQLMFFVGLAMTGFFLDSQDWKVLSIIFLAAYIISLVWVSAADQNGELAADTLLSHWFSVEMVWAMICPAIGLGLGGWFLYRYKKPVQTEPEAGQPAGQGTAAPAGGENTAAEDAGSPAPGDSVPAPERKEDGQ